MDDPTTSGVTEGFGLMFYNARFYDPYLNQFAQPDTIVPDGPQGYDRYTYANNNPIEYNDPSGHCPTCLIGLVVGAIALTAIVAYTHPNLSLSDYATAAVVGATAGLLVGTGVGGGLGIAMAAAYVGAGAGIATAAAAYTVTSGASYNTQAMGANAMIGGVTGGATALTGPSAGLLDPVIANGGTAWALRAGIAALGTQASQIVDSQDTDHPYPTSPDTASELALGSVSGGLVSVGADLADVVATGFTNSEVVGTITYQTVKNFGTNFVLDKVTNWADCIDESARTGSACQQ
jgi:RHS repeat-associated protein